MGKVFSITLRILLLLLVLALLGFAAYQLHRHGYTWMQVGAAAAAIFALLLAIIIGRRLYYQRREEKFIRRIVEHDMPTLTVDAEQERLAELRMRWSRGVDMLRKARAHLSGDPLYALPWFLFFGESGSGKSTAISHARIMATASDAGPIAHMPNTRNCDWWFFDKSVILDTAGRYAIPQNDEADSREWEAFLTLLASHRRREPLNGLILTLSAERLYSDSDDDLTDYGRQLRKRMDSMLRVLGARFPVYVLVTKIDKILGVTAFAQLLSATDRHQALGLLNTTPDSPDSLHFLDQALAHVRQRINDMSLLLTIRAETSNPAPAVLSQEMSRIEPKLAAFVRGAFSVSSYTETPVLRGIFFSSGCQQGQIRSRLLDDTETFKNHQWPLPGTETSFFLQDFFETILPRERSLAHMLDNYLSRLTLTRNMGLVAWQGLLLAICIYCSISFVTAFDMLSETRQVVPTKPNFSQMLGTDSVKISHMADVLTDMDNNLRRYWWMFPGRSQCALATHYLQNRFADWLRITFFVMDEELLARTLNKQQALQQEHFVQLYEYLAWTNSVLANIQEGKTPPKGPADSLKEYSNPIGVVSPASLPYLENIFVSYARWETPQTRNTLFQRQRAKIQALMGILGNDLHWITPWLNSRASLSPVRLSQFWPSKLEEEIIPRAYTPEGRKRLDAMLANLTEASNARHDTQFQQRIADYRLRYAQEYRSAWWQAAAKFNEGSKGVSTAEEWRKLSEGMGNINNIFFNFIRTMATALAAVDDISPPSELDSLPKTFIEIVDMAVHQRNQTQSLGEKVAAGERQLAAKLNQKAAEEANAQESRVKLLTEYMDMLAKTQAGTRTDANALSMITAGYAGGKDGEGTPINMGMLAFMSLRGEMDPYFDSHSTFWTLAEGPLALQTILAVHRSACVLNDLWESDVLSKIAQLSPEERWDILYGDKGALGAFTDGPAKPFLVQHSHGWKADSWLGIPFPLQEDFLRFLGQKHSKTLAPQDKYPVKVTAHPFNVNDLSEKPFMVSLRLACGDKMQQMDNFNYPVTKEFLWEPAACGAVTLEIAFKNLRLKKVWNTHWAFQAFIRQAQNGLTLMAEDFPEQAKALDRMDFKSISIKYAFFGAEPVLELHTTPQIVVPEEIAQCALPELQNNDTPLTQPKVGPLNVGGQHSTVQKTLPARR